MKRILSLFIIALMLLTVTVSATSDYERELLSALSIMQGDPNGSMRYEDSVSRAECAKIVVAASNYRNNVPQDSNISPFNDVPYTHWASAYIATGIKYGLLKGYLDGNFRPDSTVLYEEAITMFLRVLGYSDEDMGTDWPYDRIDLAESIGLLNNVYKTVGQPLTRRDVSAMAYNTLMANPKNSSVNHLTSFNKISDPKTVKSSSWYEEFGADSTIRVVRDGVSVTLSDVLINDICYYMPEYNTALVYSKKVTGIFESALPNKEAPTSVTVSGIVYNIEGIDAYSKLSAGGTFKYGDTVTLLLGKTGDVADVMTNTQLSSSDKVYGFLTEAGTKQTTVSGSTVTKPYVKVVLPTGEAREYITTKDYSKLINSAVSVNLKDGTATVSADANNNGVSGKFLWDTTRKIGKDNLSADVKIIEVSTTASHETAATAKVFPQRLNGITLSSSEILYASKNADGFVDSLILTDTTGDMHTYGIMTKAKSNSSSMNVSGSYEYIADGNAHSVTTQGKAFNVSSGQAVKITSDGRGITSIAAISKAASGKISSISGSSLTLAGKTYTLSDKVQIYVKSSYDYTMITSEELTEMTESRTATIYQDSPSASGGRVRIIILS